ncbi:MAG TPA: DNA polymerase III subunit gamma and tau [Nocardioidaceae bacterium]|nr:DNA polymerase III subunit gamma and tau [Nocardioidaceae bacterium]
MDAPLALYRRYRPETFAEVIGQEHVTAPLRAALTNNRVHHAYLFSGPRGCGKTTSARILARCLNCEQGPTDTPCGVCRSCTDLTRSGPGSIDVIEIDAASHGGVDDARDLRERAFFAPVNSRYKVYIIDEAHMVSTAGFNALLKLVEEPPEHIKFVFATTEPEKVIGTIRSRTHHYPFRLIPPRTLSEYLGKLCVQEGVSIDQTALPLVVRAGGGSARDTLSVLDQLMGGAGPDGVTYELATGLLGYTPDSLLDEVVDAFAAGDGRTVFGVVDKVIETGQDPRRFTEDLLRRLRDLVVIAAVPDAPASGLIDVSPDQAERLVAQTARFGRAELGRAAELVAAGLTELKGATAPRLLLELICARVLLPGADHGTEGVLARLDRIEKRMSIEGTPSTGDGAPVLSLAPTHEPPPVVQPPRASPPQRAHPTEPVPGAEPAGPAPAATPVADPSAVATPADGRPAGGTPPTEDGADSGIGPEQVSRPQDGARQDGGDAGVAEPGTSSGLTLVDVRRLWPDLLEAVKLKRRFTWILLSQNAQVAAVDDTTLTIALVNAGARNSFTSGGSEEILRQAAIDVIGHDWRVESIVDPSAQPGGEPRIEVTRPAVSRQSAPEPPARPSGDAAVPPAPAPAPARAEGAAAHGEPAHIASARGAIQGTRPAGDPRGLRLPEASDADADRDDPAADGHGLAGAELLERELGASIIEEIRHD